MSNKISKEQKLIDIIYEVGNKIHTNPWFKGKSNEEVMEWISGTLRSCKFNVVRMGMSWGTLVDE